jgi:reactive intermediate/imine deaminase
MHRLAIAVLLLGLPAAQALPQGAAREAIGTSSPTLTPAIRVGNMVYGSGQLGMSRQNPDTTIQGQTRLALENIKRVFEQAGTTMANAVKCTVFLTDVKDFAGMNEVYRTFWPSAPPARSTVAVAALVVPNAKVEIECIAAMP